MSMYPLMVTFRVWLIDLLGAAFNYFVLIRRSLSTFTLDGTRASRRRDRCRGV